MRCPTVSKVAGGAYSPGRRMRRVLRVSSTAAILSMFLRLGTSGGAGAARPAQGLSHAPREARRGQLQHTARRQNDPGADHGDGSDRQADRESGAHAFRVFEDDVEQRIVSLSKEEGPVSVGFVFDASSSMKNRMDRSVAAIQQFLETNMPGDEYFLVRFADQPTVVTGFTSNPTTSSGNWQPYNRRAGLRCTMPFVWACSR